MDKKKSFRVEILELLDQIDTEIDNIAEHAKDSKYSGDEIYDKLQQLREEMM